VPGDDAATTPALTAAEQRFDRVRRTASLFAGPALFALILLLPPGGLSPEALRLAAVLGWVIVYWVGEAIPIPATALLGPVLCVLLGVAEPAAVLAPFAHPIVFLFLGSFLLAEGMIVHRLNERLALTILSVRWLVARPGRLAVAVGLIPLSVSMWISDSATTAMVYPILLGILATFRGRAPEPDGRRFETGLLLTISYAALIGGVGTPVGTPPNLIGIGMLDRIAGHRILFVQWMFLAVPILVVEAACMFLLLRFLFPPSRETDPEEVAVYVRRRRAERGRFSRGEKNALFAFLVAVVLWVVPGLVASIAGPQSDLYKLCERHIPEGVASLVAALLLFFLPVDWKARRFTLEWSDALRIDWGTILLFGGGMSLGQQIFATGLAGAVSEAAVSALGMPGPWLLVVVAIVLSIALSELASNTASANVMLPLMIGLAQASGAAVVPVAVAACLASSFGFMLPVSTPPNAIIYGSGRVPLPRMMATGIVFDIVGAFAVWLTVRLAAVWMGW